MINTPRKNGYSFKYGTLFYVPFFSCHLGISETFIRLYIYAIDFLLISSIFSNLSLKIFFIINRVLEHTKKNKKMEIEKFIKSLARKAKLGGRYSTANTYLYTLHSFQKFAGKASLTFEEITPESIKEYEQYLILNGKRYNTISLYMRMLRSICNQASEQNIASLNTRELFENVFIGNEPTAKRAISPVLISRLLEADFSKNSRLDFARDLFLLSFYLRGIPFVDLVHLRKTDVQGNMLVYFRQKTGQQLTVIIENCAKVILRKYASLAARHQRSRRGGAQAVPKCIEGIQQTPQPDIRNTEIEDSADLLCGTPQLGDHGPAERGSGFGDQCGNGACFREGDIHLSGIF